MSLLDQLRGQSPVYNRPQPAAPFNPIQAMRQLQADPVGMMRKAGYNIPDGMTNPMQIVQYLFNSDQVHNNQARSLYEQQMASYKKRP